MLYLSVSALKRPSCTIRGVGSCSGSPGSRLKCTEVSCCFSWDSSSLLASFDFGGTASFTSANTSGASSGRVSHTSETPRYWQRARGSGHRPCSASLGESVAPPTRGARPLLTTPPTGSFRVPHAPKGATLACRPAPLCRLPGPSTARAARTARLSSESSTNIQCGRIWRLRSICFTWRGREGAAEYQ